MRLNHALGYDFNTVELAVRDGIPYAIDFCNPAPDADIHSVGQPRILNGWWKPPPAYAIERAQAQMRPGEDNLTWGTFIRNAATGGKPKANPKATAKTKSVAQRPGRSR